MSDAHETYIADLQRRFKDPTVIMFTFDAVENAVAFLESLSFSTGSGASVTLPTQNMGPPLVMRHSDGALLIVGGKFTDTQHLELLKKGERAAKSFESIRVDAPSASSGAGAKKWWQVWK